MRLHRFFGDFDFKKERLKVSDPELINQWRDVLRFEVGSELILCDGNLNEALARISSFSKSAASVEIRGISRNESEPERNLILYASILKGEHFEFVVEKATEIGVKKIVPIVSSRTIKQNIRADRLKKIIKEAAEQSGRGIIPELGDEIPFLSATRQAGMNGINFFFDAKGEAVESFDKKDFTTAGVFIGPEGGWADEEIDLAKKTGFHIVSLGKLTLRAETAAIIAAYSVLRIV